MVSGFSVRVLRGLISGFRVRVRVKVMVKVCVRIKVRVRVRVVSPASLLLLTHLAIFWPIVPECERNAPFLLGLHLRFCKSFQ